MADERTPFVRATVVRAQRPTSAHAGDIALIVGSGDIDGFVGGNCVESSVRSFALQVLATREPLLLRIMPGEQSHVNEEGAIRVSNPCLSGGAIEIFLEPQIPAPRMLIVGATPIASALAAIGAVLGFEIAVSVPSGPPVPVASDDAAVIVASHGFGEESALEAALRAGVSYVALVASQVRGAAVLASLDVDDVQRARVHSPAGLLLGGHTPAEVALSIVAELVQERAAATAGSAGSADSAGSGERAPITIDPVCGMSVVAVAASLRVDGDAGTTYFCSEGCRRAFLADPGRYAVAS